MRATISGNAPAPNSRSNVLDPDQVEPDVVGGPHELAHAVEIGSRRHDRDTDAHASGVT